MTALFAIAIILTISISTASSGGCPCNNATLCENIRTNYSKELYGFLPGGSLKLDDTSQYNWTYITAMAISPTGNETELDELMCESHKNGVRMINWIPGKFPFTNDTDTIMAYIEKIFNQTTSLFFDGVTFDYEGEMLWNQPQSAQYVNLINLTTQYFHKNLPGSTVSVCVPFDAFLEWGRQYDYYNLALAADYLYIMDYDVQTQIYMRPCIAAAVSPYETTKRGITSYLNLGINPSKLILGIPWYARAYYCILNQTDNGLTGHYCPIIPSNARDVNCTSINHEVSGEVPYRDVMDWIYNSHWNTTQIRWDPIEKTHNINLNKHGNDFVQVWYDDSDSLIPKYQYAKSMGLRGVGPFQFGDIMGGDDQDKARAQLMWSSFDAFFV